MVRRITVNDFGMILADFVKSDRFALVCFSGDTGQGKSCLSSQLGLACAKPNNVSFSYEENMTYQRTELKKWIDGDSKGKGRKPEYSVILADEIISMFFKRNWYDSEQIDGIELLNKCRDRHLVILGNIPNFWDLDSGIYSLVQFRVHIHRRGLAWVFEKDENPFEKDVWHRAYNKKRFAKDGHPYSCKGFVCEIHFNDWKPQDKQRYYSIRNQKRLRSEGQRAKAEKYRDIKEQRDTMIRMAFKENNKLTNKDLHNVIPSLSTEAIRLIRNGDR